jgi:2-polyprenyl-3-methyl-5-hydroxy-6-metoxy-1,4-benzoquinol methylase
MSKEDSASRPLKPCTICREWNGKILSQKDGIIVIRCNKCGLYYVDSYSTNNQRENILGVNESQIGIDYLFRIYKDNSSHWDQYFNKKMEMLEKISTGRRLLDIGCGPGYFVSVACNMGWDAYGLDSSRDDIEFGRQELKLGERLMSGDIDQLDATKPFDVVTLFSVIEHIDDPYQFILKIKKYLKQDGVLLIKTPNQSSLITKIHWFLLGLWPMHIDSHLYNHEHIYRFSPATLTHLLNITGYKILKLGYDDHFWITATRYLYNNRNHRLLRYIALLSSFLAGKLFRMQNQLLVISQNSNN